MPSGKNVILLSPTGYCGTMHSLVSLIHFIRIILKQLRKHTFIREGTANWEGVPYYSILGLSPECKDLPNIVDKTS